MAWCVVRPGLKQDFTRFNQDELGDLPVATRNTCAINRPDRAGSGLLVKKDVIK